MSVSPNFCRLCLQKLSGAFTALSQDLEVRNMLKHLFPGMNMDLVPQSKICNECFNCIQFSYTLRETVIKNEQRIILSIESIKNTTEENTCRLCLNITISEGSVLLYENVNQAMSFLEARSIIEIAIVTMRFEIFKKPVVCSNCWKIIRLIYLFKKKCFATEKILTFYCTKNNLTSLVNKDMESVSICYNLNLQKFSNGDKPNLLANLIPRENIESASQTSSSIGSIIKPIDVYLNNFSTAEDDDIFDEEDDDIFVESPKIVKEEALLADTVKEEWDQQNTSLDKRCENLDQINLAAKKVKLEKGSNLNNTQNDIPEKGVEDNPPTNKISDENFEVLKESPIKNQNTRIVTTDLTEKVGIEKKSADSEKTEIIEFWTESSEIQSKINNISEETKIIPENNNRKMEGCSSERKKLMNSAIETKSQRIESHKIQKNKVLEHDKKGLSKLENLVDNKSKEGLDQNDDNPVEDQDENIKKCGTRKRKNPAVVKSMDSSKNISEDTPEEIFEPLAKKQKNVESINASKNCYYKCKKNNEKDSEKKLKSIGKKVKKDDHTEWHCNQCEFSTKYRQHLTRHSFIHNNKGDLMTCSQCVYSTYIKRNLERHMLIHSNIIKCNHCSCIVNKFLLREHMLTHQKGDTTKDTHSKDDLSIEKPSSFKCQECLFVTNKESQIIAHLRTHKSQEKIFKCTECHYITTRTHSLKDHMELHKKDSSKLKTFKCKLCSFTGKRHTHLLSHMLTHETEFKFNCNQCSYKAKRKSHLVTHMLRHQSGDKKIMFQCRHCRYKSIRREHLKSHCRNMHPGMEDVDCNEAQVTMQNDDNGSTKAKKTAKCPYCPYRYYTSSYLNDHIVTAHFPSESKEMYCNDCSYKTDTRRLFVKHLYNVHRKNGRKKNG